MLATTSKKYLGLKVFLLSGQSMQVLAASLLGQSTQVLVALLLGQSTQALVASFKTILKWREFYKIVVFDKSYKYGD